jgi:hypothetical protein
VYLRNWPGMLLLLDPLCQFARNCAASALALLECYVSRIEEDPSASLGVGTCGDGSYYARLCKDGGISIHRHLVLA